MKTGGPFGKNPFKFLDVRLSVEGKRRHIRMFVYVMDFVTFGHGRQALYLCLQSVSKLTRFWLLLHHAHERGIKLLM